MAVRPVIYVSAVSQELRSARQVVATALEALGYEPAWDDIADTDPSDQRRFFQRQIDATDRQIDQMVYELYGLTEEEIKIIEGS